MDQIDQQSLIYPRHWWPLAVWSIWVQSSAENSCDTCQLEAFWEMFKTSSQVRAWDTQPQMELRWTLLRFCAPDGLRPDQWDRMPIINIETEISPWGIRWYSEKDDFGNQDEKSQPNCVYFSIARCLNGSPRARKPQRKEKLRARKTDAHRKSTWNSGVYVFVVH